MLGAFDQLIKAIVADEGLLAITYRELSMGEVLVTVQAGARDMGRLIGRAGKVADSLRVIISAIGYKESGGQKRYSLEIKNKI